MNPKWEVHKGGRKDVAFERFVRKHICCVPNCREESIVHHIGNRHNDSYSAVPLCVRHHTGRDKTDYSIHGIGNQETFEKIHLISLREVSRTFLINYIIFLKQK